MDLFITFAISLVITMFFYLLVPVIVIIRNKQYPIKTLKRIAIINGIVVWFLFQFIALASGEEVSNGSAAFLWSYVGYWLMKKKCLSGNKTIVPSEMVQDDSLPNKRFRLKINHIIIFSLFMISAELLYFTIDQKTRINTLKEEITSVEKELDFWKEKAAKPNYVISYEVSEVIISAQSAAGVGDVFYLPVCNLSYRMLDNNIGDTYKVNYKINGDPTLYDYDEDWYCVTLDNGNTGFVWGGRNNMYVREILK
ncbi:MAG: hypothetical protein IJA54_08130 [Tyzzerella sp.]|nr:hypothetical protein [Tyzzerella sp.]